jgi:hypothetical protein
MKEEEFRGERERLTHECQQAKIAFDKVVGSEAQYQVWPPSVHWCDPHERIHMCTCVNQAKLRRLEADFDKLEQRVQKEVRAKDTAVRQGLTIVGTLSSRVDTKPITMEATGTSVRLTLGENAVGEGTRLSLLCQMPVRFCYSSPSKP